MSRKTFKVAEFKEQVNEMLATSTCSHEIREGMMTALEQVLHDTGNYYGFRYLDINQVPDGYAPGINLDPYDREMPHRDYKLRFIGTDSTRVRYF